MSTPTASAIVPVLDENGRFPDEFQPLAVILAVEVAELSASNAAAAANDAAGSATAAAGSATAASGFADDAEQSAEDSDGFRGLSSTAAQTSSEAAVEADRSRAAAALILESIQADRGVPNGLAILDASGRLPSSMLPDSALEYMGTWDAATNTPPLSDAVGDLGDMWRVNASAVRDLGSGPIDWNPGDYAIHNGDHWEKADGTDAVQSVAGKTGTVVLVKADVGLPNVDNTSDANKPVSTAMQTALNDTVNGGTVVGDILRLTKVGGGQADAGNVRGPKGDSGDYTAVAGTNLGPTYNIAPQSQTTVRGLLVSNLTFTLNGTPIPGAAYTKTLVVTQAATGGPYTVAWPSSIRWAGGAPAPVMPTVPGARMIVHLLWDGLEWTGFFAGVTFP